VSVDGASQSVDRATIDRVGIFTETHCDVPWHTKTHRDIPRHPIWRTIWAY